jgi:hypothetical protein
MKMNRLIPVLALTLAAGAVALPAAAQSYSRDDDRHSSRNDDRRHGLSYGQASWQNINQRQANLDRRIDRGVRNGDLSRREAVRLRGEFNTLARLEQTYRRVGLTQWERADLDRRYDRLSAQVRYERRDNDNRRG